MADNGVDHDRVGTFRMAAAQGRMRIRVLEVLATLRLAGAERAAVSLACVLDRAGFESEVVSLFDAFPEGFEPVLNAASIGTHHLGKRGGLDVRMFHRLASVMRSFRPVIVHTHSYVLRYALPARLASGGGPIVHTIHNIASREGGRFGTLIHRIAIRAGVHSVAVSHQVARSFAELYGRPPATVIPNGIDLERFRAAGQSWKRTNGFADSDRLIVSVARLDPQKNPLGLIDAFAGALAADPHWHLLLVGDGSLRKQAEARAKALMIGARIQFLGIRPDIDALLPECDLFALASDWEGMPMAVIEAMAAGLPVAATAVGGVPELVVQGVTGLLVPPGETQALADALALLARDPGRRRELGSAARERAACFGLDRMIAAYAQLFARLAGGLP
jgi:glycosyltransferase involved in cell wall biosynthesis